MEGKEAVAVGRGIARSKDPLFRAWKNAKSRMFSIVPCVPRANIGRFWSESRCSSPSDLLLRDLYVPLTVLMECQAFRLIESPLRPRL